MELYALHRLTIDAPGEHLFAALAAQVPGLTRRLAREAVAAGLVRIDGETVREPKHALPERPVQAICDLRQGIRRIRQAQLHGSAGRTGEEPFRIVHEDAALVVVDKAAGVISAPMHRDDRGHVPELLRQRWRKEGRETRYIGVVHRLDRETSGCQLLALTREAHRLIAPQFARHGATRTYRCLVMVAPREDAGEIEGRIGRGREGLRAVVEDGTLGKSALSRYRVLRRFVQGAELEVSLETGRTHQIRVHLADIGCPVHGDPLYARRFRPRPGAPRASRLMLHAAALAFDHPATGRRTTVAAPLPEAYVEFAKQLAAMAPEAPRRPPGPSPRPAGGARRQPPRRR